MLRAAFAPTMFGAFYSYLAAFASFGVLFDLDHDLFGGVITVGLFSHTTIVVKQNAVWHQHPFNKLWHFFENTKLVIVLKLLLWCNY